MQFHAIRKILGHGNTTRIETGDNAAYVTSSSDTVEDFDEWKRAMGRRKYPRWSHKFDTLCQGAAMVSMVYRSDM